MIGSIAVANAPVSFGAFEVTVGHDPNVPDPLTLLDAIRDGGYDGTDLGPLGYLGGAPELPERLAERGLALAGGFIEFPFTRPEAMEPALQELERVLDVFDAVVTALSPAHMPRPTIADTGSPRRRANPGRAHVDRNLGLDAEGWNLLAAGVRRVHDRCRERGYEPTLHPETGTYVEAPWEIERLLDLTPIGLCLETGHQLLGGGDPVDAVQRWAERINHIHLKDAHLAVVKQIVDERAPVEDIWRRRAFCALGDGDLDVDAVLRSIRDIHYNGWIVIEQDRLPRLDEPLAVVAAEQAANRRFLQRWL